MRRSWSCESYKLRHSASTPSFASSVISMGDASERITWSLGYFLPAGDAPTECSWTWFALLFVLSGVLFLLSGFYPDWPHQKREENKHKNCWSACHVLHVKSKENCAILPIRGERQRTIRNRNINRNRINFCEKIFVLICLLKLPLQKWTYSCRTCSALQSVAWLR
jgi:hypothetical protein